jgi:hypothetical protein
MGNTGETQDEWQAIPEATAQKKVNVNVYNKPKLVQAVVAAPAHIGFTASQAQKDLNSYFNSIGDEIHDEERKEAETKLQSLGVSLAQQPQQQAAPRRTRARAAPKQAPTEESRKQNSMYALIRKAVNSEEFQRALVCAWLILHTWLCTQCNMRFFFTRSGCVVCVCVCVCVMLP